MVVRFKEGPRRSPSYVRVIILNFIRIMLLLAVYIGTIYQRDLVLVIALIGLFVTFLPWLMKTIFGYIIPAGFEIIVILFIYGVFVFGGLRGNIFGFWWWDILLNFFAAVTLGFVGLTILSVLESEDIIDTSSIMMGVFTFFFAVSLGGLWEVFEYSLDNLFGFGLQIDLSDTMKDMAVNIIGALVVSSVGVHLLRSGKNNLMSTFISRMILRNFHLFRSKKFFEYSSNIIEDLVAKGEGDSLEFKSTLRKNLYTNEFDKNMGHAVLKTIVAYLNSEGGTLLVGVDDSGKIIGLEKDEFENHDKLQLYFTGLLRNHLGNQFLPFVKFELYPIGDKHVLKVDCSPSNKRVFLKWGGEEEFYARHGAATMKLAGNDLIDYVEHRFD
ncbi:MAG: ATP-binding protein [archaeon]